MIWDTFKAQMTGMAIIYKEKIDDEHWPILMHIYWQRFKQWSNERFVAAVTRHLEISKFFPKPSELIELGRMFVQSTQPAYVALPRQEETPDERVAREEAMAAMKTLFESDPPTTRANR